MPGIATLQVQLSRMYSSTLVLIRHAHVVTNEGGPSDRMCGWFDPPLSPRGREQAAGLRTRLAAEPPAAALYASPLRRAKQTARAVAGVLGLRPHLLKSLREIHCGSLDGLPLAEIQSRHPELWQANLAQADEMFCWPGGESYHAFRSRVLRAVRRIAAAHPGQRIVIVTHAGVISQVVGALTGTSAACWEAFRAGNASLTEVRWQGDSGALLRFDDRGHLGS